MSFSSIEDYSTMSRVKVPVMQLDPTYAKLTGSLTVANGHTSTPAAPDQAYTLQCVYSDDVTATNHLQCVSQPLAGTAAVAFDVSPNGDVNFPQKLFVAGQEITPSSAGGVT